MSCLISPELLAPAGDLERLKIAVLYGADAVYIGGEAYGLRAKAKNFNLKQMEEGIIFAHERGVKIYVTANIFAHNSDFNGMGEYFKEIEKIGADALIISDPGVFSLARKTVPGMEIHISTQANNTNYISAAFWYSLGAKRIVVARELSMGEIHEIRENIPKDMDIEAFVHGAMCISYSGRCLLSNYLTERDANKGECSHPCRWKYNLVEETRPGEYMPVFEDERGTYIYNSKDLCMIHHVPELIDAGVASFKIEGRMKTPFYVGTVVKAYREAIDDYFADPKLYESKKEHYIEEVSKASHREFTTAFYFGKPSGKEQIYTNNAYIRGYDFIGVVYEDYDEASGTAIVMQRNKFETGDKIEVMPAKGKAYEMTVKKMWNEDGEEISSAPHPQQIIKMLFDKPVRKFDILRKKSSGGFVLE
ncbi:MAG: U32 family peptidase [Lachnospiraceae bacterium]|nr:U32 family peptidase [Lachnospiraceae bacterium]